MGKVKILSFTTDDMLKQFIASKDVTVTDLECVSHENAFNKSYKVNIYYDDFEKVMSPDFWPNGVGCRQYVKPRTSRRGDGRIPVYTTNNSEPVNEG